MISPHNLRQKQARLSREIAHFESQCARFACAATPQEKRARTLAARCLRERQRDMARLLATTSAENT